MINKNILIKAINEGKISLKISMEFQIKYIYHFLKKFTKGKECIL